MFHFLVCLEQVTVHVSSYLPKALTPTLHQVRMMSLLSPVINTRTESLGCGVAGENILWTPSGALGHSGEWELQSQKFR